MFIEDLCHALLHYSLQHKVSRSTSQMCVPVILLLEVL